MILSYLKDFKNIGRAIKTSFDEKTILDKITLEIQKTLNANLLLVDKNGYKLKENLIEDLSIIFKNEFTEKLKLENQVLNHITSLNQPKINITLDSLPISLAPKQILRKYYATISNLIINDETIAVLILYKKDSCFDDQIELTLEYITQILSLILNYNNTKKLTDMEKNKTTVKSAIATLSYSELDAIIHIFDELDFSKSNGFQGIIIASKIADKFSITRSVIVNALRKLESAGVFETRSLGMKGTYIKVINNQFIVEINKFKNN